MRPSIVCAVVLRAARGEASVSSRSITLRGVEVHNLKSIDLDLPHRRLIVFCGVSGSGKSSLAFDTLYAAGQRRYIESFSAYTRRFLERLEKPAAARIDGIPAAIAVVSQNAGRSSRSTVGTSTEISDYLRLLFAKIGRVFCQGCGREVRRDTPQSVADSLARLSAGARYLVTFPREAPHARRLAGVRRRTARRRLRPRHSQWPAHAHRRKSRISIRWSITSAVERTAVCRRRSTLGGHWQ